MSKSKALTIGLLTTVAILAPQAAQAATPQRADRKATSTELPARRPWPTCYTTVPDVMGQEQQSAIDELTAAGIDVYVWQNKEASLWIVVAQTPAAGDTINRCVDDVEIWVGL
jgi:hypothetical protein